MKTLMTGWSLCLAIAVVVGCSDSPTSKKVISTNGRARANTTAAAQNPHGGMSPEDLAKMMTGSGPHQPQTRPFDGTIKLGPKLSMAVPKDWEQKPPRVGMIAYEFATPSAEGDDRQGRVTVMAAGGSIEANIQRWIGQFTQPDESKTADKAKTEKKEIAGHKVHLVDIPGTYNESTGGGPFAPGKTVQRPDYRMLAAIVETPGAVYFIKFYGPAKTVGAQADAFHKMIDGLTGE